jgi:hypothetical protein
MARKGDAVSRTLDALLSITYRSDPQKFVFNSNVANSKGVSNIQYFDEVKWTNPDPYPNPNQKVPTDFNPVKDDLF